MGGALASLALHAAVIGVGVGVAEWRVAPERPPAVTSVSIVLQPAQAKPSPPDSAAAPRALATLRSAQPKPRLRRAPAPPPRVARAAPLDAAPAEGAGAPSVPVESPPVVVADTPAQEQAEPESGPPEPAPLAAPSATEALPSVLALPTRSHARRFRVFWGDFTEGVSVARLDYRFERDGDHYTIHTAARAEGLMAVVYSGVLTQSSVGHIGPAGLEPLRYVEQRGKRPERSVTFDREAGLLQPVAGPPVALPGGTQDRLSVFYQLGAWARADPARFTAGQVREWPVASMRGVQIERFEVLGDEVLATPAGLLRALHLRRAPPSGTDDPEIQVWLGYDFEMLPIRLRAQDARGRVLDQIVDTRP